MSEIISQLEKYSVATSIAIFICGTFIAVIAFFIKRRFFPEKKNTSSQFIKSGGSISNQGDIVAGNKVITNNTNINVGTDKNLDTFYYYLEKYSWNKELIEQKEVYICEHDNLYQIEISEKNHTFSETWTKVYPDSGGSCKIHVYLTIGGNRIKQLIFVSVDGGRIFVPLPERTVDSNDRVNYYWERSSLSFKVAKIIGEYDIYESIEGVARRSKIKIID